ncbi:hypothetical protein RBB50_009014 [Rhinocladiella similis]
MLAQPPRACPEQLPLPDLFDFTNLITDPSNDLMFMDEYPWGDVSDSLRSGNDNQPLVSDIPFDQSPSNASSALPEDSQLVDEFLQMGMPPILETIENGPKWTSAKALLESMATSSSMVRHAIMAFSAVQLHNSTSRVQTDQRPYYERATRELSRTLLESETSKGGIGAQLRFVLATIFLLAYTNLVTDSTSMAHANLTKAHRVIHHAEPSSLGAVEHRLISWIRLVDARAVSAGGEGLLLAEGTGVYAPHQPSPRVSADATKDDVDGEIEEIVFDILYQPGIIFFQKIQSFMGRITQIDQWHRSRGTVEDETEVMATAAIISKDLQTLYDQRPALMDHAVQGKISENILAKNLVVAITRSFRTYLANFWACHVHLHRVAYKHLPRTKILLESLQNIKTLVHLLSDSNERLPVNLLWPLLMWGCEEDDHEQRRWILATIRGLEHSATNAKATADLLEEVQKRQDQRKQRADVREVSHDLFKGCFAIV